MQSLRSISAPTTTASPRGPEQRIAATEPSPGVALGPGLLGLVYQASLISAPPRVNSRGGRPTRMRNWRLKWDIVSTPHSPYLLAALGAVVLERLDPSSQ